MISTNESQYIEDMTNITHSVMKCMPGVPFIIHSKRLEDDVDMKSNNRCLSILIVHGSVSGIISLMTDWARNNCPKSADKIIVYILEIEMYGRYFKCLLERLCKTKNIFAKFVCPRTGLTTPQLRTCIIEYINI
jgi:hypothetical protein